MEATNYISEYVRLSKLKEESSDQKTLFLRECVRNICLSLDLIASVCLCESMCACACV